MIGHPARGERRVERRRHQLLECSRDFRYHLEISALAVSADVVALADSSTLEDSHYALAMVFDEKPVANVAAVAIDPQVAVRDRIQNRERNQLLRKLKIAVVVRAVRDQDRQAVRLIIRAREVIG
jgi:hypothetical protein